MENDIRRTLVVLLAETLYEPSELLALSDADIELAILRTPFGKASVTTLERAISALKLVLDVEVERRVGAAVTRIRDAEGIDRDQVDQVLGVQEEDL